MKRRHIWNEQVGPAVNARRELPAMAADFFAQVRDTLAGDPTPTQLHQVRLAAKRIRYTLELFRPCYGPALEARLDSLRQLQQVLGEINDSAVTLGILQKAVRTPRLRAGAEQYLSARMARKTAELRKLWADGMGSPNQESLWLQYLTRNSRPPRRVHHRPA